MPSPDDFAEMDLPQMPGEEERFAEIVNECIAKIVSESHTAFQPRIFSERAAAIVLQSIVVSTTAHQHEPSDPEGEKLIAKFYRKITIDACLRWRNVKNETMLMPGSPEWDEKLKRRGKNA